MLGQTSVVRMIDKLESMEIVKKYRMIGTLEKKKACLTSTGRECYEKAASSWKAVEHQFMQTLNEPELETLEKLLACVYENSVAASETFR